MAIPGLYSLAQKIISGPLHKHVKKSIQIELPDTPNTRVLDVGCGLCNYSLLFNHATYIGFDSDSSYIDYAKKKIYKTKHHFFSGGCGVSAGIFRKI